MTLDAPLAISDHDYSAAEWRRLVTSFMGAHEGSTLATRTGVLSGMSGSMSGLQFTLGSGTAIVTPSSDENGSFTVANAGPETVTLAARDTAYTRWDIIYLRVFDDDIDGSGRNEAVLEVATGVPAVSPSEPSLPAGSLRLYRAVVPPNTGTVTLVDRRPRTAAPGGVVVCTSTTRPTSLTPADAGFVIWESNTKTVRVWDGSTWTPVTPAAPVTPHAQINYKGPANQQVIGTPSPMTWGSGAASNLRGGMTWTGNQLTVPRAGRYSIANAVCFSTGSAPAAHHWYSARVHVNGAEAFGSLVPSVGTTTYVSVASSGILHLSSGDKIDVWISRFGSAPARTVHTSETLTYLNVSYLGE